VSRFQGGFSQPLCFRDWRSALFYAIYLMAPVLFKLFCPVMHKFKFPGLNLVKTLLTLFGYGNQPDFAQHAEVLRDGRLGQPQRYDQCADRNRPAPGEKFNDLTPPRLRDGVENVAGCCSTWHEDKYIPM
jgi:hypothetical protein